MVFAFATCDRNRALGFLKKLYPSRTVEDTPEDAGPLLDLIESDLIRVCDPDFHAGQIIQGPKWDDSRHDEVMAVCTKFHEA